MPRRMLSETERRTIQEAAQRKITKPGATAVVAAWTDEAGNPKVSVAINPGWKPGEPTPT